MYGSLRYVHHNAPATQAGTNPFRRTCVSFSRPRQTSDISVGDIWISPDTDVFILGRARECWVAFPIIYQYQIMLPFRRQYLNPAGLRFGKTTLGWTKSSWGVRKYELSVVVDALRYFDYP